MQAHCGEFRVCAMCRVLRVNRSGYYAWLRSPKPDTAWASDFTFIRTHEGWMYLAVVIDLFSWHVSAGRCAIGPRPSWSCRPCCLRCGGANPALVAWFTRTKGRSIPAMTGRVSWRPMAWCSMSRRGNCHDNAPVESFFGLLKRERIRRRIYPTKNAARAEVFDYIEMFLQPQPSPWFNWRPVPCRV
ncbi:hypothetical protein XHV734_2787 [Xanthomonas hortorum pv. vitians]|nr:hypothetical protein XHV734_2787 [Xanthomonas hortorum pv. vitians]